jgi:transcriptional regulator with XRE-family HTH domain
MTREEKLIRWLDENPHVSARDLAARIGTNHNYVTALRNGVSNKGGGYGMTGDNLLKIAEATGLSADWLRDDAQGWPPVYAADRGVKLNEDEELILRLVRRLGAPWALARLTGSDGTAAQPIDHEPAVGQPAPVDPARALARPDGPRTAHGTDRGQKAG